MSKLRSPLSIAFNQYKPALIFTAIFSVLCNLLLFVGPLYMLQIYDRVLSSRSIETLIALTVIAAFLLLTYGLLDYVRSRILVRAGAQFDAAANEALFKSALKSALHSRSTQSQQAMRDLDSVRDFWSGPTVLMLFDAPFAPIFVAVCFLFHVYLGVIALVGALLLFTLALMNEFATRHSLQEGGRAAMDAQHYASTTFRNVEVIQALGMQSALHRLWNARHERAMGWQARASDRSGMISSTTKFVRSTLQIAILGAGAFLAVSGEISAGVMIAASIMMGRALQPVEQAVGQWKSFVASRGAWSRLEHLMKAEPQEHEKTSLPAPKGVLSLDKAVTAAPGGKEPILKSISFSINAGESLGIVGPSAAGKSTLARVMVGVWPLTSGTVRLDGAELSHWDSEELGQHIGYLPQDVELFSGTVRENIARWQDAEDSDVIAAAKLAGAHELIQSLPDGYNTNLGEMAVTLSGGQRQRIGLARAVFGNPCLLVLDEPNAHLDSQGEVELMRAITQINATGTTVIVITHKPMLLRVVSKVMVLKEGAVHAFGPTAEVLKNLASPRVVSDQGQPSQPAQHTATTPHQSPNSGSLRERLAQAQSTGLGTAGPKHAGASDTNSNTPPQPAAGTGH